MFLILILLQKFANLFRSVQYIAWKFCTITAYVALDIAELHVTLNFRIKQNLTYDNTEKTNNQQYRK